MQTKYKSLREIEGRISPHQSQLDRALKARAEALSFINDVDALADFIGGKNDTTNHRADWAIMKEIFPGVNIHFLFYRGDSEFPANLKALFSGTNLGLISGEDLVGLTIPIVSHMLRHIRIKYPDRQLPEIVYRA